MRRVSGLIAGLGGLAASAAVAKAAGLVLAVGAVLIILVAMFMSYRVLFTTREAPARRLERLLRVALRSRS
jgi:ABC-type nickel/cobalt efflux system permease component RcnA